MRTGANWCELVRTGADDADDADDADELTRPVGIHPIEEKTLPNMKRFDESRRLYQ